jgi:hypothetical protein
MQKNKPYFSNSSLWSLTEVIPEANPPHAEGGFFNPLFRPAQFRGSPGFYRFVAYN